MSAASPVAALMLVLAGGGAASAPPAGGLCGFLAGCRAKGAICVIAQLPPREAARIRRSEAYGDMTSQIEGLQARRGGVRQRAETGDVSRYISGVRRSARLRTIFLGAGGRSIEADGLFADDPTPVVAQLDATAPPEDLPEGLRAGRWRANQATCRR